MFDSTSNLNPDPNPSIENTIIVSTSHVQKVRQKRYKEKEFIKGGYRFNASSDLSSQCRRIMITFKNEAGYKLLLADTGELSKLKKNSHLDLAFLQKNNQYRVHLYYKARLRTRYSYWAQKYPGVKKIIEKEELDVRTKVDLENNSLSKAIGDIQIEIDSQKALSPNNSPHENPPTPPEYIKGKKKVKVRDLDCRLNSSEKKTKDQLRRENEYLKAELEQKSSELNVLKDYLSQRKIEAFLMQAFLDYQDFLKNPSAEPIKTLSPTNKNKYENMFGNKEEKNKDNTENPDDTSFIGSPESSVPTESEFSC